MSCSLTSSITLKPRSMMATTASGPAVAHSSRPTLATPNHGLSASASRVAATMSSTSRARINRSRSSMDGSGQLGDAMDMVAAAPPDQLRQDAGARLGVGERGRADLHGVGPGEEQLDGVVARAHAADAHDGGVGEGHAA